MLFLVDNYLTDCHDVCYTQLHLPQVRKQKVSLCPALLVKTCKANSIASLSCILHLVLISKC